MEAKNVSRSLSLPLGLFSLIVATVSLGGTSPQLGTNPIGAIATIGTACNQAIQAYPHSYYQGADGNLWSTWSNNQTFMSQSRGTPPGVGISASIGGAAPYAKNPYLFVKGSDGNLWVNWYTGKQWAWASNGTPPGVGIDSAVGVVPVLNPGPFVFIKGTDGNLWLNWWNGSAWVWTNHGTPNGVAIAGSLGAATNDDTNNAHAFIKGSDGNLWQRWWNGSAWLWLNLGKPIGVDIVAPMGAIDFLASNTTTLVFVKGADGNLWMNQSDGSGSAWTNAGTPMAGIGISGALGAINIRPLPGTPMPHTPSFPYVFLKGSDGNLWVYWLTNNSGWQWANNGNPGVVGIDAAIGVAPLQFYRNSGGTTNCDAPSPAPYVFVKGTDGTVWLNYYGQNGWGWMQP